MQHTGHRMVLNVSVEHTIKSNCLAGTANSMPIWRPEIAAVTAAIDLPQSQDVKCQVVVERERVMMTVNGPRKNCCEKHWAGGLCKRARRHRQPIQRRAPRRVYRIVGCQRHVDENLICGVRKEGCCVWICNGTHFFIMGLSSTTK